MTLKPCFLVIGGLRYPGGNGEVFSGAECSEELVGPSVCGVLAALSKPLQVPSAQHSCVTGLGTSPIKYELRQQSNDRSTHARHIY